MKKVIACSICIILLLSLSACSSKAISQELPPASKYMSASSAATGMMAQEQIANDTKENDTVLANNIGAPIDRKIIYEAYLNLEALDFDTALTSIMQKLDQLNGYTSKSSIEGKKGENNRFAEYTFRVPQQNYNDFKTVFAELTNVLNQTENANDITSEYVDIEARLKSLHTQEERLLVMMESAGELDTLLAVQNQLADVQYRIESITAQKNTYDKLTQYATVNITLYEVSRITETQKDSFTQRLGVAFRESWISFDEGLQRLTISIVYSLPTLLIFALCIIIILLAVRKLKAKKQPKQNTTSTKDNTDNK